MRKRVVSLALLLGLGVAHAESGKNQLFDCMDTVNFEMNNQCMADTISQNIRFRDAQQTLVSTAADNFGDYAIATMTFDPERMQIDIVAHRDALQALNLLVNHSK